MAREDAERLAAGLDADDGGRRGARSPVRVRGRLGGLGAAAVAIHRTTGSRELAWRFAKARARTLTWLLGVEVDVLGREHLAGGGPFVFAPNHQSHLDILVLLGFLPGRTRFAAKRELWRHPVIGAVLDTLGMIPIEREHPERAVDALNRASTTPESVVVFPEGTRSRTGALLPFKKGAFVLAIASGLPIGPAVCRGRAVSCRAAAGSRSSRAGRDRDRGAHPDRGARLRRPRRARDARRAAIERHHTGW
jgi:1-acyl-sn-glycerol-3-phosphate acyltransferase